MATMTLPQPQVVSIRVPEPAHGASESVTDAPERPPVGSGDFYRAIAEAVPLLVWTCLPDGQCDYLSPQWVAYTGIPAAPQLGYNWIEQVHPDDRASALEAWNAAAGSETAFDTKFRIRRHDGVYHWFKTLAVPQRDESGCVVRWYGANTDIQYEREVEDALRSSTRDLDARIEARTAQLHALNVEHARTTKELNAAQRISHVGSWRYDPASADITWSEELFRVVGLPNDNKPPSYATQERIYAPESWKRLEQAVSRCIKDGLRYELELELIRADTGERRWTIARGEAVGSADGQGVQLVGTLQDVTELRRARDALVAQKQALEASNLERTHTAEELRSELTLKGAILNTSGMAIFTIDVHGAVGIFNRAAQRMLGYTHRDIIGRPAARLYAPHANGTAGSEALAWWQSECAQHENAQHEWTLAHQDGSTLPVLLSMSALREGDRVRGYVCLAADISQFREAQSELQRLSRRLSLATSGAGCGIWEWNLQTNGMHWDDQMFRLYGQSRADFVGAYEAWQTALHPDDRERAEREVNAAATGVGVFDTTFRVCWPDGTVRHIRAHAVVDGDEHGRATSMLGTSWDVTKEANAERALRARTALLREFVAHAPAAIAMLDRQMRYLQTSQRWITDYNLVGQELVGRSHYELFPDIPEHWKQVHQRALEGAIEACDEDSFPRQDGGLEWLQWEVRPWHTEDGEIGGVLFFTQVVTARKNMELMLRSQKTELERSNSELQQFAYAASHDLQEPLRAIGGFTQILAASYKEKLDPSADKLIGHITDGVERMNTLIRDLLTLSQVTAHPPSPELVDSAAVCAAAMANLTAAIRESDAQLQIGTLPRVFGDQRQLTQLFQNLIGNALKYRSDRRPELHIACEEKLTEYEFSIRDNGIGIAPPYFERIFGVFQRLHTRNDYPGTGIGLAICQKVVLRHAGRIWVESSPGQGSTFRFTLPRGPRSLGGRLL